MSADWTLGEEGRPLAGIRERLRRSRNLIWLELLLLAAIFVADDVFHAIWLSKTLYLFALGVASLLVRGIGWKDIGFRFSPNWPVLAVVGLLGGALIEVQELYFTQPLLIELTGRAPDLSDFRGVKGNWTYIWLGLPAIWALAAFGEEWVWRGYVTNRLADLFGRRWPGWLLATLVASAAFGLAHLYQGPTGMAEAAEDGLLFAVLYFATGRNLMAPMIAHGVQDTIDLVLGFTGTYPIPI
jgi:membrane protease YdiL (CAAX protease family)